MVIMSGCSSVTKSFNSSFLFEGESSNPCSVDSGVPQDSRSPETISLRELHQGIDYSLMIVYSTKKYIPQMINYYSNMNFQPYRHGLMNGV